MGNNETTKATKLAQSDADDNLSEAELDQVSGGLACDGSVSQPKQLNIGTQSTAAGASRVTFNPFSIKRK